VRAAGAAPAFNAIRFQTIKSCFARLETFFESSTTQHIWMLMESLHMTGTPCHSGIEGMCRLAAKLSGLVFD